MKSIQTVDDYIAQAPKEVQGRLHELRAAIMAAAPDAEERISYGMPSYHYKGQRLVYFQLWKKHIGLYGLSAVAEQHKSELEGQIGAKGSIRLPLNEPLPTALIKELVKAQVKMNDEAGKN